MPKVADDKTKVKAPRKPRAGKKAQADPGRPVLYPDPTCVVHGPDDPLTGEWAEQTLGWEEVGDNDPYLLLDTRGKRVVLRNNLSNRPFDRPLALRHAQSVLMRRWKLNGQTIVIGRTGITLSCQHRLVGLAFARQMWEDKADPRWRKLWPDGPPTMESYVAYGIDEGRDTIQTIDADVRPRSDSDVMFTIGFLQDLQDPKDRRAACKAAGLAVRWLWDRTGMGRKEVGLVRTTGETVAFVDRHPRVEEAVRTVWKLDAGKKGLVSRWVRPGEAAALLYLMGASKTDREQYRKKNPPAEKDVDWTTWDRAVEYWGKLADDDSDVAKTLREVRRPVVGDHEGVPYAGYVFQAGSTDERVAVLLRGWASYLDSCTVPTPGDLQLDYSNFDYADPPDGGPRVIQSFVPDAKVLAGGIDSDPDETPPEPPAGPGPAKGSSPLPAPTKEEVDRAGAEGVQTRNGKVSDTARSLVNQIAALRADHPDKVLLFYAEAKDGTVLYNAYGPDAAAVESVADAVVNSGTRGGLPFAQIDSSDEPLTVARLISGKRKVARVYQDPDTGKVTVTDRGPKKK